MLVTGINIRIHTQKIAKIYIHIYHFVKDRNIESKTIQQGISCKNM